MKKAVPEWTCYPNNLSFLARLWERIKPDSSFSDGPPTDKRIRPMHPCNSICRHNASLVFEKYVSVTLIAHVNCENSHSEIISRKTLSLLKKQSKVK